MASLLGDNEINRYTDRIRAVTFKEARDAGAAFITRKWIAQKLKRSERWVSMNWNKTVDECVTEFGEGRPLQMSQESHAIVADAGLRLKMSNREVAKQILQRRGKSVSYVTVHRDRQRQGFKAFRVIPKPLKTERNLHDRLWFAQFLSNWDEADCLHIVPSDEFFIYVIRKANTQNDRIWARSLEDIPDDEHYRQIVKCPDCIGLFAMFSAKRLMWVIKEQGVSWDGEYFRETVLKEHVLPFMADPINVLDTEEACFLHDNAPCFKSRATQDMLFNAPFDFFASNQWPGNSPDLNPAEHIGALIKEKVETRMLQERGPGRYARATLMANLLTVLHELEFESDLFERLLIGYPKRLRAVIDANGGHTKY